MRVVGTMSEDTDHIDLKECHRRGIEVVTLPKMSTDTVSTLTMAILRQTLEGIDRYFVDRIFSRRNFGSYTKNYELNTGRTIKMCTYDVP